MRFKVLTPAATLTTPTVPTTAPPVASPPASSPQVGEIIQRIKREPRSLTRADVAQLQRTIGNAAVGRLMADVRHRQNETGLPDGLKHGIEARSGLSMDDVRVHRDSPEPAKVEALAFARGTEIHLAPGQERHLAHEAWHVVQQKQGRVAPTSEVNGVAINDDASLEREATRQGASAVDQVAAMDGANPPVSENLAERSGAAPMQTVQRTVQTDIDSGLTAIQEAFQYASNVEGRFGTYIDQIHEIDSSDDHSVQQHAEPMAYGFSVWAQNYNNKNAAYLFEAEEASRGTQTRRSPTRLAILGADTDQEPDLTFLTYFPQKDQYGTVTGFSQHFTATELKASTSSSRASVDSLLSEGMKQLKKRENTNNYQSLILRIDNTNSCWPWTEIEFNNFGQNWANITRNQTDARLLMRVQQSAGTNNITKQLTVIATYQGVEYARCRID